MAETLIKFGSTWPISIPECSVSAKKRKETKKNTEHYAAINSLNSIIKSTFQNYIKSLSGRMAVKTVRLCECVCVLGWG